MIRRNGLLALKGDLSRAKPLRTAVENRASDTIYSAQADNTVIFSTSKEIDQGDLLVGFNGYLEDRKGVPEKEVAECVREHGGDFLKHLNGSFRLALYDIQEERLHVSGGKVGKKVLYYTEGTDDFLCSSHLSPLLKYEEIDRELNKEAVSEYLQSWSVSFGGGERLIEGIRRLHPSHRLIYSDGERHISKFWEVYDKRRDVSDRKAVEQMDNLLKEAAENLVERVDGPINVFLSGGFDSVFLTTLISEVTDREINTYTWGWKDEHFTDAEKMSDKLGTKQHSLKQDYTLPSKEDLRYYEEPQNAFVRYPFKELYQNHRMRSYWTGLNSQATFPVCLKNVRKLDRARKLKKPAQMARKARLQKIIGRNASYRLSKGLEVLGDRHHSAGIVNDWGLRNDQARDMLSPELRNSTQDVRKKLDERWNLEQKSHQENYSYMQLRSRDTARYAYYAQNMEHIDVYGYTPLVEYSYSLPMSQKKNRRLLQRIAKNRVPDEIINKGASGWEFVSEQFKQKIRRNEDEYRRTIESFLERGYIRENRARKVLLPDSYEDLTKGPINQMIAVYLLEKWIQLFIDSEEM